MRCFWPQSLNGRVFVALVLTVIFINFASLALYGIFRDETAAAAAASQAADQIIVIKRLVERAQPVDRRPLITRLSSPLMNLRMTTEPIVEQSDDQFASRIVLRKLQKEFPALTDIRVDSRIDLRAARTYGSAKSVIVLARPLVLYRRRAKDPPRSR